MSVVARGPRVGRPWVILYGNTYKQKISAYKQKFSDINVQRINYTLNHGELIEKVQKRMSKNIQGMKDLMYDERLTALNLDSLEKRRHIFDLTEIFRLIDWNF